MDNIQKQDNANQTNSKFWQKKKIVEIVDLLKKFDNVQAVILKGSFCDDSIETDIWSDIDLVIILNDNSAYKFFDDTDWLNEIGQIFAIDRVISEKEMTLRVCLNNYQRFDFTFIDLNDAQKIDRLNTCKNLYSKNGKGKESLSSKPFKNDFHVPSTQEVDTFTNNFWFSGVVAIGKIARKDYLVGSHLALEMAQKCIVLQMMIRDEQKGTNIHRAGEGEKVEIFSSLSGSKTVSLRDQIILLIDNSACIFNKLAKEYSSQYTEHYSIFKKFIDKLKSPIN